MNKRLAGAGAAAAIASWLLTIPSDHAQTSGGQSNYTFRFNTGISALMLQEMTFENEQQVDLGSCTVTEKVNGPIACAVNCQGQSVCLLQVSGPAGSGVTDAVEKVSETPVGTTASPSAPAGASAPAGLTQGFGALLAIPEDPMTDEERRIEAYKSVGP